MGKLKDLEKTEITVQLCWPKKCHFIAFPSKCNMFVSSLPPSGKSADIPEESTEPENKEIAVGPHQYPIGGIYAEDYVDMCD